MTPADLHVLRPDAEPSPPPPDRGRLLTAAQVAAELLGGTVSPGWVRDHVPYKLTLGIQQCGGMPPTCGPGSRRGGLAARVIACYNDITHNRSGPWPNP